MKTQKAQWARLEDLNKRRVALEKQILTAMESVEFHTGNIIKEINVILEGRILELQLEDGLECVFSISDMRIANIQQRNNFER